MESESTAARPRDAVVLPAHVRLALADLLGVAAERLEAQRAAGGCISPAARVDAPTGAVFVKWRARDTPADMYTEEAAALRTIREARAVRVPDVLAATDALLALEWLEHGTADDEGWRRLGRDLAQLHRSTAPGWGWPRDNYIGTLPQSNAWATSWPAFIRDRRIAPRLAQARAAGVFNASGRALLDRFVAALDDILAPCDADGPSLLHGDLWRGNAIELADGSVALIDPASCYGHREMDLAMAELFGGFPASFFAGYEAEWPTRHDGRAQRRAACRVYYLLVHVNLFGAGYARATLDAARAALA